MASRMAGEMAVNCLGFARIHALSARKSLRVSKRSWEAEVWVSWGFSRVVGGQVKGRCEMSLIGVIGG